MAPTICNWPFLSSPEPAPVTSKSFAQAVSAPCEVQLQRLPPKVIIGDTVRIKLTQREYEAELEDCKRHLHGRVTLQKGGPSSHCEGVEAETKWIVASSEGLVDHTTWQRLF